MQLDVALAWSSDRYGKFDFWSVTIQTPATITPLLRWLSTKHNLIDLAKKANPADESKNTSKKV
jgi:hypothetical protein